MRQPPAGLEPCEEQSCIGPQAALAGVPARPASPLVGTPPFQPPRAREPRRKAGFKGLLQAAANGSARKNLFGGGSGGAELLPFAAGQGHSPPQIKAAAFPIFGRGKRSGRAPSQASRAVPGLGSSCSLGSPVRRGRPGATYVDGGHGGQAAAAEEDPELLHGPPEFAQALIAPPAHLRHVQPCREDPGDGLRRKARASLSAGRTAAARPTPAGPDLPRR